MTNKVGFGFLRLPAIEGSDPKQYDYPLLEQLVDRFLELGGDYFDTAYTYPGSEEALRRTLVERHPQDRFRIANKLPGWKIGSYEECQDYFDEQLRRLLRNCPPPRQESAGNGACKGRQSG